MLFTEPASEKNNLKLILIILPINSQYLERGKIYGLFDVRYHAQRFEESFKFWVTKCGKFYKLLYCYLVENPS